jgi:hypothetical protein
MEAESPQCGSGSYGSESNAFVSWRRVMAEARMARLWDENWMTPLAMWITLWTNVLIVDNLANVRIV